MLYSLHDAERQAYLPRLDIKLMLRVFDIFIYIYSEIFPRFIGESNQHLASNDIQGVSLILLHLVFGIFNPLKYIPEKK